jgi:hypothetical protein
MKKSTVKNPHANRSRAEHNERDELLAWYENYEPRTELGRKLVARRIVALKAGQTLLDYKGIMREAAARRGGRRDE